VRSPRERELLRELARTTPLARPERFGADHRATVAALESLRRHGYHGSRAGRRLGPLRPIARRGVELVARYIVVSYVRSVAVELRNLYRLREIEAGHGTPEARLLRPARIDAAGLLEITQTRAIGLPTFLIGGLLVPIAATAYRGLSEVAVKQWVNAIIVGLVGALIGVSISWIVLRGTAMASHRIRLSVRAPLHELWTTIGSCGRPPRDQSRTFAIVAITLTIGAWVVLPTLVAIALAS
jgi:hypothetical protein